MDKIKEEFAEKIDQFVELNVGIFKSDCRINTNGIVDFLLPYFLELLKEREDKKPFRHPDLPIVEEGNGAYCPTGFEDKQEDKLQQCLKYCQEQNGLPYCKNCGLDQGMIKDLRSKDRDTLVEKINRERWLVGDGTGRHAVFLTDVKQIILEVMK
jgi:hypothetical protein